MENDAMHEIYKLIESDKELLDIYLTDPIFHTSVIVAVQRKMSVQDALIFLIKNCHKSKTETENRFDEHMQTCGFKTIILRSEESLDSIAADMTCLCDGILNK